MASYGWTYIAPYDSDVRAAFQKLRADIFARGDYFKPWEEHERYHEFLLAKPIEELTEVEKDQLRYWHLIERAPGDVVPDPLPQTIEELHRHNAEFGTRSILDIEDVSTEPELFKACPIADSVLQACFGTNTPSREQLEANPPEWDNYVDSLESFEAIYFTVYRDGQPHEIVFVGYSRG